ncbi:MAG: hypothetical protein QM778_28090 [Myxococcales bacterium]
MSRRSGAPERERVLVSSGADCRELDATVAFIIALTIDPRLGLAKLPPELAAQFAQEIPPEEVLLEELNAAPPQPVAPAPAPAVVRPVSATKPPSTRPAPAPPGRTEVALAGAFLSGTLPQVMVGAGGAVGVKALSYLTVLADAHAFFSPSAQNLREGRARFRVYDLGVSLCPTLPVGRLQLRACAGPLLMRGEGLGQGFKVNHRAAFWDVGLRFGGGGTLALRRGWGLFLDVSGRVRFNDKSFKIAQTWGQPVTATTVHRLGLMVLFGPSYRF